MDFFEATRFGAQRPTEAGYPLALLLYSLRRRRKEREQMYHRKGSRRPHAAALAVMLVGFALLGGCRQSEPENKITYTPVPGAGESQDQRLTQSAEQTGAGTAGTPAAKPNDPMNDPELARKGREIFQRTGGDVNKMTPKEKETFMEAVKNGHL
jgi:hypothetical protein